MLLWLQVVVVVGRRNAHVQSKVLVPLAVPLDAAQVSCRRKGESRTNQLYCIVWLTSN